MKNQLTSKNNRFKYFCSEYGFCFAAFIVTAAIMLITYFIYGLYPFGDKNILWLDMEEQYSPFFTELYDRVVQGKSLIYSWRSGLGMPFLADFFNYLSSPFLIIIFIFGRNYIPEAIAAMILLKASCASCSFAYYLKKSQGKISFLTTGFGVVYSMSGWFVAYYWNLMWLDVLVLLPLVVLGIEKIIGGQKPLTYIISLGLTLLTSYYMGYMVCLFSCIYFLVYYFSGYSFKSRTENSKIKSTLINRGVAFTLSSFAGAGIAAISLIPTFINLQNSSATSEGWPKEIKTYFNFADFLAAHLDHADAVTQFEQSSVTPNVCCGIITVILVIAFFFNKSYKLKEKIITGCLLVFFYLSFNLNYLNYIWHAFHLPNGLPNRFAFLYVFFILLTAYKAIKNLDKSNCLAIAASVGITGLSFIVIRLFSEKNTSETLAMSLYFLCAYAVLLFLAKKLKSRSSVVFLMLVCMVIESMFSGSGYYIINKKKSNYLMNYNEVCKAVSEVESLNNKNDFYRMEVSCDGGTNRSCIYCYNSVSGFSSMAYESIAKFEQKLGCDTNNINMYNCGNSKIYDMMHSIKYRITWIYDEDNERYVEIGNTKVNSIKENKYYLPLAFAVNKNIVNWELSNDGEENQKNWFCLATGTADRELTDDMINLGYELLKNQAMSIKTFEEDYISGSVNVKENCVLYTSIPYDKGWNVKIDGEEISKDDYINLADAFLCVNLPAGEHTVEFDFTQRGLMPGIIISSTSLILIAAYLFIKRKRFAANNIAE